jgi:hypothetical protein
MRHLPSAGIGDGGNSVSSDADGPREVVSCRLPDGSRQEWRLGQISAAQTGVAYQTAWTMAHKLRHGLSEDPARPLRGFLKADETFIGGRGDPTSRSGLIGCMLIFCGRGSVSKATSAQIQSDGSAHLREDRPESGIEPMGGEPSV